MSKANEICRSMVSQKNDHNDHVVDYLIIGSGLLASHLAYYFRLKSIPFWQWSRQPNPQYNTISPVEVSHPAERLQKCCHPGVSVLLAIKDDQIDPFIRQHPFLQDHTLIHFSGALSTPLADSAHPLMTFSPEMLTLQQYECIPFVCENNRTPFAELFPQLNNPAFTIESQHKPLYHALCSLLGNYPALLWSLGIESFKKELGLPVSILEPFLLQTVKNTLLQGQRSLTGPLARGDQQTVALHIKALEDLQLRDAYENFVRLFNQQGDLFPHAEDNG